MKAARIFALCVVLALLLAACSMEPSKISKWQGVGIGFLTLVGLVIARYIQVKGFWSKWRASQKLKREQAWATREQTAKFLESVPQIRASLTKNESDNAELLRLCKTFGHSLEISRQVQHGFMTHYGVGHFMTAQDGSFLEVNDAWCRLSGLTPAQTLGRGWINSVHPNDRRRVLETWGYCVADKRADEFQFRMRHTEGDQFLVNCWVTPRSENNEFAGFFGYISPVKPRRQTGDHEVVQ